MKATGIVRGIDDLGRIVIPKEIRRVFGIKEGDGMEIYTDEGGLIILKKFEFKGDCVFCGVHTDSILNDKHVCKERMDKIEKSF